MADIRVVTPDDAQLRAVASHRFDLAMADVQPAVDRATYTERFLSWAHDHADSHVCRVAIDTTGAVIGFGFLAVSERVPDPHTFARSSGDLQAVYVLPPWRNQGVGGHLVDALIGAARERGVEHVTVHSSVGAANAYRRAGFAPDPLLLLLTAP